MMDIFFQRFYLKNQVVYADKAYESKENFRVLKETNIKMDYEQSLKESRAE